tara:strand:- start:89 stop:934 length:846 start_codon:yes stop_codon:yes gene_type:complete
MEENNKNIERFIRMNGAGNKFLVYESFQKSLNVNQELVKKLYNTQIDDPFDQFVLLEKAKRQGDAHVSFWNADGSTSGMCGNALRCVAHLVFARKKRNLIILETINKDINCWKSNNLISVDVGIPSFEWNDIPLNNEVEDTLSMKLPSAPCDLPNFSAVNIGNPHAVFFFREVTPELKKYGYEIENNPIFPERVNVSFANILNRNLVKLDVWERGSGITLACGSAACATVAVGSKLNLMDKEVEVSLPGGILKIVLDENGHIILTGPYEIEKEIKINLSDI